MRLDNLQNFKFLRQVQPIDVALELHDLEVCEFSAVQVGSGFHDLVLLVEFLPDFDTRWLTHCLRLWKLSDQ